MKDADNDHDTRLLDIEHRVTPHCQRAHTRQKFLPILPYPRIRFDGLKSISEPAYILVRLIGTPGFPRVFPDLIQVPLRLDSELIHGDF